MPRKKEVLPPEVQRLQEQRLGRLEAHAFPAAVRDFICAATTLCFGALVSGVVM